MTYCEIINLIKGLQKTDPSIHVRIAIASAIDANLDLRPYDNDGVDELGNRFFQTIITRSDWPDFDEIAYQVQSLLDQGVYESPTLECFEDAYQLAKERE